MIAALATLLCLALLLYLALGRLLRRKRKSVGLHAGRLIAGDDSRLHSPTLRSSRLGLIGRPDHLLQFGRVVIPVEQKPHARHVQPSHVMQVAAQCIQLTRTSIALALEVAGVSRHVCTNGHACLPCCLALYSGWSVTDIRVTERLSGGGWV
jgi:hypothetical protein